MHRESIISQEQEVLKYSLYLFEKEKKVVAISLLTALFKHSLKFILPRYFSSVYLVNRLRTLFNETSVRVCVRMHVCTSPLRDGCVCVAGN